MKKRHLVLNKETVKTLTGSELRIVGGVPVPTVWPCTNTLTCGDVCTVEACPTGYEGDSCPGGYCFHKNM